MMFLFIILMVLVFGKLVKFAFKAAWSITMILLTLCILPIILVLIAVAGFVSIAVATLVVVGLIACVASLATAI